MLGRPSLGLQSGIMRPVIKAYNFEIKPHVIEMLQNNVQFEGLPEEDANAHIANFLEICDTFKINKVFDDAIQLCLFSFTPRDKAKSPLKSLLGGSITSWQTHVEKFLGKYFPLGNTTKLINDFLSFQQADWNVYMKPGKDEKSS